MSNVYLVVSNNKSYQCKSTHSSTPYIKVSNSYLDLASTTTKGTQIKFNINNKTYRPKQTYTTTASKSSQYNTTTGYIGVKSSSYNTTTSRTTGGYKLNTYDGIFFTDTTHTNTNTYTVGKGMYETFTEDILFYPGETTDTTNGSSSYSVTTTSDYDYNSVYTITDKYTQSRLKTSLQAIYSYTTIVIKLSRISKINDSCFIFSIPETYSDTAVYYNTQNHNAAAINGMMDGLDISYPATSTSKDEWFDHGSMSIHWFDRITYSRTDKIKSDAFGIIYSTKYLKTTLHTKTTMRLTHNYIDTANKYYFSTSHYNNNGQHEVLFSTTQTTETNKYWKSYLTTKFTTNSVSIETTSAYSEATTSKYSWNGIPATTVSTETNTTKTQNYTTTSNNINSMSSTTALTRTSSRQSNYNTNTEL